MTLKQILAVGGFPVVAAFVGYSALVYTEDVVSTFPTYAAGIRDSTVREWLPSFVPQNAFDIRGVHNLDTNQQWLRYSARAEELREMLDEVRPISLAEARARHREPRRWRGTWPAELDRFATATPRATLSFHDATDQHGRLWCLAVDRSMGVIYGWTCRSAE